MDERTPAGVAIADTGDGAYRIDQPHDIAWLAKVLGGTDPRFDD